MMRSDDYSHSSGPGHLTPHSRADSAKAGTSLINGTNLVCQRCFDLVHRLHLSEAHAYLPGVVLWLAQLLYHGIGEIVAYEDVADGILCSGLLKFDHH
jgi:hypothetical protein